MQSLIFLITLSSLSSFASVVKTSFSNGGGASSYNLAVGPTLNEFKKNNLRFTDVKTLDLSVSAGLESSSLGAATETTNNYGLGFDFSHEKFSEIYLGFGYEKSQLGQIQSIGPSLSFTLHHDHNHYNFELGKRNYLQKGTYADPTDWTFAQTNFGVGYTRDWGSWFTTEISATKYDYDQNISDRFNQVDSYYSNSSSLNARGSNLVDAFSSLLDGLVDYSYGLSLGLHLGALGRFEFATSKSITKVSLIWSTSYSFNWAIDLFKDWSFNFGASYAPYSTFSQTALTPNSLNSSEGTVGGSVEIAHYF